MTEQSTAEAPPAEEVGTPVTESDPALKTTKQLFRFTEYLNVGEGADDCAAETAKLGSCDDPEHFHAWLRIPNPFQHREIREKSLAAKARRMRLLRDPNSDAHEILEADLDLMRHGDHEVLVDEIANKEWWRDHMEATKDVEEDERWEHIRRDQERLRELEEADPEQRPTDEYEELLRHTTAYHQAVEESRSQLQEPRRQALLDKGIDELIDLVRDDRITADATQEFMHVYATWTWLAGTYRSDRSGRRFGDIQHLQDADEEVIDALKEAFERLEIDHQKAASGNS